MAEAQLPDLPLLFPQQTVPEHQVLLSFVNDADAAHFENWWLAEGRHAWLAAREADDAR